MTTRVLTAIGQNSSQAISEAVDVLRDGGVVALPTETVYGLGADATNADAVDRIFRAKERPANDPLIVHLPRLEDLYDVTIPDSAVSGLVSDLAQRFWPGPLTMILPSSERIAIAARSGLPTVAVRMSAHPVFRAVADGLGRPIAAPSANRFGRISPTTAAHVVDELDGRIPLVLDGGPTEFGVESTIIRFTTGGIEILRPGPITPDDLSAFGKVVAPPVRERSEASPVAPGLLASHYAPRTPLSEWEPGFTASPHGKLGLLAWNLANISDTDLIAFAEIRELTPRNDATEAAKNLYGQLRELDEAGLDRIFFSGIERLGIGIAIADRLVRASH
jgi:L-threonylcarbamoyladenylate synthase